MQDHAHAEVAAGGEVSVAGEVAQAVGDQVAVVELHAAQHVRSAGDDQAGAGVDGQVGEGFGVAAVLAQVMLLPAGYVIGTGAFRAGVHVHHDHRGLPPGLPDERASGGQVQEVGVVGIGREGHERDLDPVRPDHGDLARQPGLGQARGVQRPDRLGLAGGAEVEGVVVRVVHDGEPGLPEVPRVGRRVPERETVRVLPRAALAGGRGGERAFQVAEHDLGPLVQGRLDRRQVGPRIRRQLGRVSQHRVTHRRDRHRSRRGGGHGRRAGSSRRPSREHQHDHRAAGPYRIPHAPQPSRRRCGYAVRPADETIVP